MLRTSRYYRNTPEVGERRSVRDIGIRWTIPAEMIPKATTPNETTPGETTSDETTPEGAMSKEVISRERSPQSVVSLRWGSVLHLEKGKRRKSREREGTITKEATEI